MEKFKSSKQTFQFLDTLSIWMRSAMSRTAFQDFGTFLMSVVVILKSVGLEYYIIKCVKIWKICKFSKQVFSK